MDRNLVDLDLWPIGNCQVSALVDGRAGMVWACVPRIDGDPLFCSLVNGTENGDGVWRMSLENQVSATPRYKRNTATLVTRLEDANGAKVDVIDFCPRFRRRGRMYRPVAFVRIVRPVEGSPRLRIEMSPRTAYGSRPAERTSGTNHIRFLLERGSMRLTTDAPVGMIENGQSFRAERDLHFFFGPDEPFTGNVAHTVRDMEESTEEYWRWWTRGLATPRDWQEHVIRAAITLKLCQHEETGAIVAAMTTSIPEAPHSGRNWDYRFCWMRDSYYTVQALTRLGALDVLEKYLSYLRNIVDASDGDTIQPLYSVMGEAQLEEWEAEGLAGYRGMGPVRIGNAAYTQVQHDVYGQIILPSVQAFFDQRFYRLADSHDFEMLEKVGERAWKLHDQPDAGLWELRSKKMVHTYSTVMSWAACDRLANVAHHLRLSERENLWRGRADQIRSTIEREAWREDENYYAAAFENSNLDASLLQMVELRFLEPDDERFISTFEAVERALRRGQSMLRYDQEDDFGKPETAFNICTFWLIEALARMGRREDACQLFDTMLSHCTPSGLLSEDLDFETGELWGNFPQTYSLVGIINCAGLLSRSWDTVR